VAAIELAIGGGAKVGATYKGRVVSLREFGAFVELQPSGEQGLLHISEVRAVAADALWLSTAQGRDSVAIHFTWKLREAEVRALLPDLEAALAPFGARPHWGKLSARAAAPGGVAALFPKLPEFLRLREDMDPNGKFLNGFVARALGGADGEDALGVVG
jgi:xylitol oxidase